MPTVAGLEAQLLAFCRQQLAEPQLVYAEPLTSIDGGHEAFTGRFALAGAGNLRQKRLILRWRPPGAGVVAETLVQNVLAKQGCPVPWVHFHGLSPNPLQGDFMIMDYHPGEAMCTALDTCLARLGETHAGLHQVDPGPLRRRLRAAGLTEDDFSGAGRLRQLERRSRNFAWLRPGLQWLKVNQPAVSGPAVICHGDLHPFNILISPDDRVSAVLDWSGFVLAEAAFDVAATVALCLTAGRCLAPALDWPRSINLYLEGYRSRQSLDENNLVYFQALKCFTSLIEAAEGQPVWHQPGALAILRTEFYEHSGLQIDWPETFTLTKKTELEELQK